MRPCFVRFAHGLYTDALFLCDLRSLVASVSPLPTLRPCYPKFLLSRNGIYIDYVCIMLAECSTCISLCVSQNPYIECFERRSRTHVVERLHAM